MATIGNLASVQYKMALVNTSQQYMNNLYKNTYKTQNIFDTSSADEVLKNYTERGDEYVKEQYEKLYNSIFGSKDGEEAEKQVSLKQASGNVLNDADKLSQFAKSLRFGDKEYDTETAQKYIESFVENYNTFIDKVGDSDNQNVLQKGVIMVNTAKAYSGSLGRVGITVGSDNKLSFNKDYMSEISATDMRTTFGDMGFSDKVAQKAEQIYRLSGSAGLYGYTANSTQNYAYNIGALFNTYA